MNGDKILELKQDIERLETSLEEKKQELENIQSESFDEIVSRFSGKYIKTNLGGYAYIRSIPGYNARRFHEDSVYVVKGIVVDKLPTMMMLNYSITVGDIHVVLDKNTRIIDESEFNKLFEEAKTYLLNFNNNEHL